MIQMSVSDQIIAVINDLCQKFGIVIDWSAETVLPYIEDLCGRYIQYEIYTSIAWCVVSAAIVTMALSAWVVSGIVLAKAKHGYGMARDVHDFAKWAFLVLLALALVVWSIQAFDIIECCTIPEKTILEYLKTLLQSPNG